MGDSLVGVIDNILFPVPNNVAMRDFKYGRSSPIRLYIVNGKGITEYGPMRIFPTGSAGHVRVLDQEANRVVYYLSNVSNEPTTGKLAGFT